MYPHPQIIWMKTTCAKAKSRLQRKRRDGTIYSVFWSTLFCFQIHELTLLCFQHEWTLLQIHRWTLLCFQIHECNINEALMETNMGPWPLQRLLTTKRPTLGQPLWNIFWSRILPPFSSLHCDCVSSIAIRFSPFSQSRLCFCGQFDNQRKRTSLSRTSMKLTCQKYNSPFQENLTRPGKLQFGKRVISVIRKKI